MTIVETPKTGTRAMQTTDLASPPGLELQKGLPAGVKTGLGAWSAGPPASLRAPAPEPTSSGKAEVASVSDDEDKAETSVGSAASDTGSVSDGEDSLLLDECGQHSSSSLLRADAPAFVLAKNQLNADAQEFCPGRSTPNANAACYRPSMNALKQAAASCPAAPPGLQTKLSSKAGAFVPSSAKAAVSLHEAAASMPGPPPGIRTKLSCKAGVFVPGSSAW